MALDCCPRKRRHPEFSEDKVVAEMTGKGRDVRSQVMKLERGGGTYPQVVHDRSTHPATLRGHADAVFVPVNRDSVRDRSVSVPLIISKYVSMLRT